MTNSNKMIAVIGEQEIVKIFQAIGYDCFYDTTKDAIIARCEQLAQQNYKIILILEKAANQITDYLASRAGIPYPIMLPIPDTITKNGYGQQQLKRNFEKAMGIQLGGNL